MSDRSFEPVRVGVAGVGNFGRLHALTLSGLGEARLVAMVGRGEDRLRRVQADLPGVQTWTDLDAALRESNAEAWVVACSTSAHVEVTSALLKAGKPVLLEKPIAETLEGARQLEQIVRTTGTTLMMGHILLFSSEFRRLSEEAGARSNVVFMQSVRHRPIRLCELFPNESPFGLLMVHDLYMMFALMNGAAPKRLSARIHRRPDRAVDLAQAVLEWPSGAIGSCTASCLTPEGMPPDGFDRLEVFGQGWAARMTPNPRPLEVWDDKARWPMALEIIEDPRSPSGMMAEEQRCFCRVVRGVTEVPLGARLADAIQIQQWIEVLEHSSQA